MTQASKRVVLLLSLCLLLAPMCSASKLRGTPRKQRALADSGSTKGSDEGKKSKTSITKVSSFDEEEDMFYGDEESLPNEISHQTSGDDVAHSGLSGMEGHETMEHNSDKGKNSKSANDKTSGEEAEPEVEPAAMAKEEQVAITKEEEIEPAATEDELEEEEAPEPPIKTGKAKAKKSGSTEDTTEAFNNYDDPEAPLPTASPTAFSAESLLAPPQDKSLPASADSMFGGNLVEPATSFGHYEVTQELVPAETVLARQKQAEEGTLNSSAGLLVAAFGGVLVFAALGYLGYQKRATMDAAKTLELSFGGRSDNHGTDTDSSTGDDAIGRARITQTVTFESDTDPVTPRRQTMDDSDNKWEETSDPWSYAGSINGSNSVKSAREQDGGSPVGRRISSIIQGTIDVSKKQLKRIVPGVGGGYKEFDDSSQASDPIFEDPSNYTQTNGRNSKGVASIEAQANLSQLDPRQSQEIEVHDL